jgi:uncharacterized protein (DUF362 family)
LTPIENTSMTQPKAFISDLNKGYLESIREGLTWIQANEWIRPNSKIFIKPNLTYPTYQPGVMTSPQAVEAAILALRDYTSHIFIGDSDSGGYNRFSMDEVYMETGIAEFARMHDVKVINLSHEPRRLIRFSYQNRNFALGLPVLLTDEIDLMITMPVPKVHANSGVSLTFKNQWGCIPENQDRLRLHPYFKHVVLEVCKVCKTKLAIVDGAYGLNVNGPLRGEPIRLDWIVVTNDLGAGARVVTELMQIPLESIHHLSFARKQGLIPDLVEIDLNQELETFKRKKFYLRRKWTDIPGLLAFNSAIVAYLGYFSPLAGILHKVLYWFREPFYDYDKYVIRK